MEGLLATGLHYLVFENLVLKNLLPGLWCEFLNIRAWEFGGRYIGPTVHIQTHIHPNLTMNFKKLNNVLSYDSKPFREYSMIVILFPSLPRL